VINDGTPTQLEITITKKGSVSFNQQTIIMTIRGILVQALKECLSEKIEELSCLVANSPCL